MVWTDDCLQVVDLDGRNVGGIDEWQGTVGGLEDLVVAHDRGPLQWQTDVLALAFVEARVDAVLEIGRGGDLRFLLLLGEHVCDG